MNQEIDLIIDLTEAYKQLEDFENLKNTVVTQSNKDLNLVQEKSVLTYRGVLHVARSAWQLIDSIISAAGGNVSTIFRSVISAAFGSISVLSPLISAALAGGLASLNPWMVAQAEFGLMQLGLSIAAIIAAESQQQQIAEQLYRTSMISHNITALIGSMNFL